MSSGNAHLPYQHCYLEAFLAQILQYQRSRNTYASMEVVRFTREGRLLGPSAVPRTNVNVYETGVGLRHPRARGACGSTRRRDRTRGVAERGLARHRSSLPACRPTPAVEQGGGAGDGGGSAGSLWQAVRGGRRAHRVPRLPPHRSSPPHAAQLPHQSRAAVRAAEGGRVASPRRAARGGRRVVGGARGGGACIPHRGCPPLLLATSCRPTPALEQGSGENGRAREGRDPHGGRRVAGGVRGGGACMAHQDLPPSAPCHLIPPQPPHWSGAAVRAAERGRGGIPAAGGGGACSRKGTRYMMFLRPRSVPSPNSPLVVRVQNYGTVFGRERAGRARGTGGAAVLGGYAVHEEASSLPR
ncbi:hypothetical protein B0H14DRAFT_3458426 [Mycena olivaceomarginata]|nr:hypothetical protein B0H14DRAFT_3458426 [Mycena olivaceomarginata]